MNSPKINIVVVGPYYNGKMASCQRIRNMIDGLLCIDGIRIFSVGTERGNEVKTSKINERFSLCCLSYMPNLLSILKYIFSLKKILSVAYRKDCRNVLYFYGYPSIETLSALRFAKRKGYVVVFDIVEKLDTFNMANATLRSQINHFYSKKMLKQIPRIGDTCFGISHTIVDYCEDICHGLIPVVHLPISINADRVLSYKRKRKENSIKVFYGGSYGFKDGISFLVKGFEEALLKVPHLELLLTGVISRGNAEEVHLLLDNSPAKEKILFLGCLSNDDYYATMVNADILCMPRVNSAFANAGFPFKLGEYLASGNVVIATNVSDIGKYLKNNESAILIQPESSASFAHAIEDIALNKVDKKAIGLKGQKVCRECFDYKKVSAILYDSIVKLLD